MSNISRRNFLKGAGVAALAVAAAGVLAGCSKEDIPDIPEVTTEKITVVFQQKDSGQIVDNTQTIEVKKDEVKISTDAVKSKVPNGYMLADEGDGFVNWDKKTVTITVYDIRMVNFRFIDQAYDKQIGKDVTRQVAGFKYQVKTWELENYNVELPDGYTFADDTDRMGYINATPVANDPNSTIYVACYYVVRK